MAQYKLIVGNEKEALQISIPDKEIERILYVYNTFNDNAKKDIDKVMNIIIISLDKYLKDTEK